MFSYLKGTIISKCNDRLILDVGGIGYEIFISFQSYQSIPTSGETYKIHIHAHYREDQQKLFGFHLEEEKLFFKAILSVNGIGPKVAMSILSTFGSSELKDVLLREKFSALTTVPGIGKKTAQRLFLELKDRCDFVQEMNLENQIPTLKRPQDLIEKDIVHALISLGYRETRARETFSLVKKQWKEDEWIFENILKSCLSQISF